VLLYRVTHAHGLGLGDIACPWGMPWGMSLGYARKLGQITGLVSFVHWINLFIVHNEWITFMMKLLFMDPAISR